MTLDLSTGVFIAIGIALLVWLIWAVVVTGLFKGLEESLRRL